MDNKERKKIFFISLITMLVLTLLNCLESFKYTNSSILRVMEGALVGVLFYLFFLPYLKQGDVKMLSLHYPAVCLFALFSSYRFIYFYTNNITRVPFIWLLVFVFASFVLFFVLYFFFRITTKDENDTLIFCLITMLALNLNFPYLEFLPAYIGFMLLFGIWAATFIDTKKAVSFLKPFCATLLVLCLFSGIFAAIGAIVLKTPKFIKTNPDIEISKIPKRDIYIILLDMYAGERTLKYLGYDNSDFYNTLKKRGFILQRNIESNYSRTTISLSSFLNADYNENLPYETPNDAVSGARIFTAAKQAGYKVYYLNSWPIDFKVSEGVIDEAYNASNSLISSTINLFVENTLLSCIITSRTIGDIDGHREVFKFANKVVERNDVKKFAFLHFLMPHPPYLYDEAGNANSGLVRDAGSRAGVLVNKEAYISYLKYTNKMILEILDKIFAREGEKPIVILMGDHGPRIFDYFPHEEKYIDEAKKYYKYRFNTFFAYYNPDTSSEDYTNIKSLVNLSINFQNDVFGAGLKNIEDKHCYIAGISKSLKNLKCFWANY